MRFGYAVNLFNTLCYILTFTMLQPSFLLPSPFVLFRGSLQNRFSAVSLTIAWANLCSGIVTTVVMRLLMTIQMRNVTRILIGSMPYVFLHLTAIVPALTYVILTTNPISSDLKSEDLVVFQGQEWLLDAGGLYSFPATDYNRIFWMLQAFSFAIVIFLFLVLAIFEFCRRHKNSAFYILCVIVFFLTPWTVISCSMYFRWRAGMPIVELAWMVTFIFPLMEAIAIIRFISWQYSFSYLRRRIYTFSGANDNINGRNRPGTSGDQRPVSRDTV
ncbi:unnamed protein product [Bursaphelenchus xylophilus]|uniref:(pine wood nematode) hypothetical protein n=1 Tax=Bursaphelenchus xylophilus TaxID=6326 RepID=A0A1I7S5G6_BURXY|nr:unnamed protein product [Bursaphelenchus xylophilus]CAG9118058.1 unnamed protein product [Bursaphelenchus xylophilus]